MVRVLTLDNMDNVPLQGVFDYAAIAPDSWEIFRIKQDRQIRGVPEHISLGDVYRLFAEGLKFHEVKEILKRDGGMFCREIDHKTVLFGQAFYRAVNPGIEHFNKSGLVRVLCDENVDPYNAMDGAQRVFGYASHIYFEGLAGQYDRQVWQKGLDFDFIISKDMAVKSTRVAEEDRDLTNCAYDAWKDILLKNGGVVDSDIRALPIIIHIVDATADGRQIKKLLKKYRGEILNLASQRKSPVILLEKGSRPKIGKHYLELIDGDRFAKARQLIEARCKVIFEVDPMRLGTENLKEYSSTIRALVEREVQKILEKHKTAEAIIPILNGQIKNTSSENCLSDISRANLMRQVQNEQRIKDQKTLQVQRRNNRLYN